MNIEDLKNKIWLDEEEVKRLMKDRLDFGFDSIYFRYAIMRDELARLREKESHDPIKEKRMAESDKCHFYMTLEQLLCAHEVKE